MTKFVLGIIAFTIFMIVGAAFLLSKAPPKAALEKEIGAQLSYDYKQFNFGTANLNSDIITHRYPIKNIGQKDLKIANLASSCACSKVYFKSPIDESPKASMKGMTKPSRWIGTLKPSETADLIFEFDPKFHGPAGVGKINRTLSFETNDPNQPYVEFGLQGEVVK